MAGPLLWSVTNSSFLTSAPSWARGTPKAVEKPAESCWGRGGSIVTMATGDASHSLAAASGAEKASSEDRSGMRGEDAIVVTTVAAPEAGRDAEQPRQLTQLGCGTRVEPGVGSPQESRKQCEFPSNLRRGRCDVENG